MILKVYQVLYTDFVNGYLHKGSTTGWAREAIVTKFKVLS